MEGNLPKEFAIVEYINKFDSTLITLEVYAELWNFLQADRKNIFLDFDELYSDTVPFTSTNKDVGVNERPTKRENTLMKRLFRPTAISSNNSDVLVQREL